jgi:hypothetical protein
MKYKLLGKRELRVSELFRNNDNWRRCGTFLKGAFKEESKKYSICLYRLMEIILILLMCIKIRVVKKYVGEFIVSDRD